MVSAVIQLQDNIPYRKECIRNFRTLDNPGIVDDGTEDVFDAFEACVFDGNPDVFGELLGVEPGFCLRGQCRGGCRKVRGCENGNGRLSSWSRGYDENRRVTHLCALCASQRQQRESKQPMSRVLAAHQTALEDEADDERRVRGSNETM